ncbi:MAG: hypothetical protein JW765_04330 [Deltaproteobacteria bacterium]|nr:hypothetical protein [Candidatus Zymogenaceae bacterium]
MNNPEKTIKTFSSYPLRYVLLSNALSLSIYALGAVIIAPVGWWAVGLYLLLCLGLEVNVLARSCVDCAYYGKTCAFGKGRVCGLFFNRGDPARFAAREISWTALIPDFMVFLIPAVVGVVLLVMDFVWWRAALIGLLLAVSFAGNAAVRSSFACKYCKQRETGCPAEKLFSKK